MNDLNMLKATRRQLTLAAARREFWQRIAESTEAADHYTVADRATADTLEAGEMLAAFISEEI